MNVLLLEPHELQASGHAEVAGRRAEHITKVLGKAVGEQIRVGVVGDKLGRGVIEAISPDCVRVQVTVTEDPPAKRPIDLVLALPRPPILRRVLQHVTSMGVRSIVLLHTARVEKSYWQSPALEPVAIDEQLRLGLEQAVDTVPPRVTTARRFKPFCQDELPGMVGADTLYVADPAAGARCPTDLLTRVVLLVGPEGGLVPFELEALRAAGAQLVGLGPRILRVETAVVALLARLGPG